jgi:hypothetical protein
MLEDRTHDTAEPVADPEFGPWLAQSSILVVDDEPGIRNFLIKILGPRCKQIETAADTKDTSCKLDEQHFDVVILDNTGLFSGVGARPLDAGFAAPAWDSDQRIKQLSGQPFSEAYLDNVLNVRGTLLDSAAPPRSASAQPVSRIRAAGCRR